MDRAVALGLQRVDARRLELEILGHHAQLRVHLAPFAHPGDRKEVLAAERGELPVGELLVERLREERPQLEVGDEIRARVVEPGLRLVGGGLLVHRPLARIGHRKRCSDDHDLLEATLFRRGHEHPRDPRVERQPPEFLAGGGQLVLLVHRAQLGQ